jgi:predicted transcriptional regulator
MANVNKSFDQFIKNKLVNHEEKLPTQAWEKLNLQLNQKDRKTPFLYLKIAASLLVILGMAYLILTSAPDDEVFQNTNYQADNTPFKSEEVEASKNEIPTDDPTLEKVELLDTKTTNQINNEKESKELEISTKSKKTPIFQEEIDTKQLIASIQEKLDQSLTTVDFEKVELTTAIENESMNRQSLASADQEVKYSIKIISNGIKEEPQKPAIINEIENKIDKIGGWLGKVDQGFADLQDAKNNLFASITTKSERNQK